MLRSSSYGNRREHRSDKGYSSILKGLEKEEIPQKFYLFFFPFLFIKPVIVHDE